MGRKVLDFEPSFTFAQQVKCRSALHGNKVAIHCTYPTCTLKYKQTTKMDHF